MGMAGAPISVTQLQAPATAAHVDHFTLTVQPGQLTLGSGITVPAWTFDGTAPGPTLRVRRGDEIVVTLVNHLSFGVTIHWHGVRVPNSADGVAGVTQDAVKPGQTYVYRFIALDAGTYWYHSHQFSFEETTNGLYGMLIVDPADSNWLCLVTLISEPRWFHYNSGTSLWDPWFPLTESLIHDNSSGFHEFQWRDGSGRRAIAHRITVVEGLSRAVVPQLAR